MDSEILNIKNRWTEGCFIFFLHLLITIPKNSRLVAVGNLILFYLIFVVV